MARRRDYDYVLVSCDGELYSIEWYELYYGQAVNEDVIVVHNESVTPREEVVEYRFSSHLDAIQRFKDLSLHPKSYLDELGIC